MNAIETIDYKGRVISIHHDEDPESPRDWDNAGVMLCAHGRYALGDEQPEVEEIKRRAEECEKAGGIVLPLYLYDHGGITISTSEFSCPWDSGQVGVILISAEKGREEWGRVWKKKARRCLVGEVETYDQYLRGDIYGYVVNEDGPSCWGYFGTEDCIAEAKSAVDFEVASERKEARKARLVEAREVKKIAACCAL